MWNSEGNEGLLLVIPIPKKWSLRGEVSLEIWLVEFS